MTVTLTDDLERDVARCAGQLGIPPDQFVRDALAWFIQGESELWAELRAWQMLSAQAWASVEESLGEA
jgi:hypothetical protein